MAGPIFPTLLPKDVDPLWFNVDKPCDDENELSKLEEEHQTWVGQDDHSVITKFPSSPSPQCYMAHISVY